MDSPRFVTVLLIGALAVGAVVVLAVAGRPTSSPRPAATPPAAAPGASPVPSPTATAPPGSAGGATPAPVATLQAVQAVKRLCDRVNGGDLREARRLLERPAVWPRRELAAIAQLGLVSAQVERVTAAGDLVLMVRLRARLRAPSPLHDGVNTLFFTLRRDGTTGDWLVTAVTSSP